MRRALLLKQIARKEESLKKLRKEIFELEIKELTLSDKDRQYSEKMEVWRNGKIKEEILTGRIAWKEYFLDEDTGEQVEVLRSQVVRKGNHWTF